MAIDIQSFITGNEYLLNNPSFFEECINEIDHGKITESEGVCFIANGMKSSYLGAFTRVEIGYIDKFIAKINEQFNSDKVLYVIHAKDNNGLINGKDVHLFSGSSFIGTFRIDINPNTPATHIMTVQAFIDQCLEKGVKWDLIIFDPPYNTSYDKKYGTYELNHIKQGNKFLAWLVKSTISILNDGGMLISKNWRSIRPPNSKNIFKLISFYGGYRRFTILEGWQYKPLKENNLEFEINHGIDRKMKWILGDENHLSFREIDIIEKEVSKLDNPKIAFISDNKNNPFNFEVKHFHTNEFVNLEENKEYLDLLKRREEYLKKRYNNNSKIIEEEMKKFEKLEDEEKESYDVIILDKCKKIGGSIPLTNAIKYLIPERLNLSGKAILKTYFNPVLEKKGLEFEERMMISYNNYAKCDLIHIYTKTKTLVSK